MGVYLILFDMQVLKLLIIYLQVYKKTCFLFFYTTNAKLLYVLYQLPRKVSRTGIYFTLILVYLSKMTALFGLKQKAST